MTHERWYADGETVRDENGLVVAQVVIGNYDDARLMAAAPELLALAQQYASECAECGGTGSVRANSYDLDTTGCSDCAHIRDVIKTTL